MSRTRTGERDDHYEGWRRTLKRRRRERRSLPVAPPAPVVVTDPNRRRECLGKRRYDSLSDASMTLTHRILETDDRGLHAYRCPHCLGYHIGHLPQHRPTSDQA